jgi:UrcA family protein
MANFKLAGMTALAAMLATAATPAMAGVRHQNVYFNDIDLSTSDGQVKFEKRIKSAVRRVCALPAARTTYEQHDRELCETRAMAAAKQKAGQVIARHGGGAKLARD